MYLNSLEILLCVTILFANIKSNIFCDIYSMLVSSTDIYNFIELSILLYKKNKFL